MTDFHTDHAAVSPGRRTQSPAPSRSILIAACMLAAAGALLWAYRVAHDAGQILTDPAVLVVNAAPSILSGPASQSACRGGTANLSVVASGSGVLTYQWRRAGVPITDQPGQISGSATANLSATVNVLSDTGTFDGVVTNACGQTTTNTATIIACIADYNCSGGVAVQDAFDFLTDWFGKFASADINGSGVVTTQDIFDFLTAFFAACG